MKSGWKYRMLQFQFTPLISHLKVVSRSNLIIKVAVQSIRSKTDIAMGRLSGKVAIVTASTEGIGFAIAKKLATEGAKVMISSRKEKNVTSATDKLHNLGLRDVKGVVCHVGNARDRSNLVSETLKSFGGIDILVSNAAVNPVFGSSIDCPEEAWDKIFDINVKCAFLLTKEVLPHLKNRNGGSVIYVSSIAGLQPFALLGPYSVSKTALLGLTKVMATELATENVRVNCIAPGIIITNFSKALHESESARNMALQNIPINRLGEPDDVSGTAAFLCSDDAKYITGETIVVSGGMQSRL